MQYPSNNQPDSFYPYTQQQSQLTPPPPSMQQYPYGMLPGQAQPAKKHRGRVWAIIIGLVVMLIVVVAVASAGSHNTGGSTPASTTQANQNQPARAAQAAGGHHAGEAVTLSGWTVTVNSVKRNAGDGQFNIPKAGNVYLFIDVTVLNNTGQSQAVSSLLQFSLKDSTGQSYNEALDSAAPSAPDGTVTNGGRVRGTLVYEVPQSMHIWEFDFQPDFGTDQAVWSLTA